MTELKIHHVVAGQYASPKCAESSWAKPNPNLRQLSLRRMVRQHLLQIVTALVQENPMEYNAYWVKVREAANGLDNEPTDSHILADRDHHEIGDFRVAEKSVQ